MPGTVLGAGNLTVKKIKILRKKMINNTDTFDRARGRRCGERLNGHFREGVRNDKAEENVLKLKTECQEVTYHVGKNSSVGHSMCKGPKARRGLICLRNRRERVCLEG